MKTKSNSFFIVYVGIFSILILIGIVLVFLGIKDTVQLNAKTKHYEKTTGYLSDYIMDSEGGYNPKRKTHSNPIYFLSYNYTVNGTEYTGQRITAPVSSPPSALPVKSDTIPQTHRSLLLSAQMGTQR